MIGLFSVTWLFLLYKFTRFLIYFLFLSDEGPTLETWDFTIRTGSTPTFFYISICIFYKEIYKHMGDHLRRLNTVSWKVENTRFRPKILYIDLLLEEWN